MPQAQASIRLSQLAEELGLDLVGPDASINGVCALQPGLASCIAFAQDARRLEVLQDTQAGAVIVPENAEIPAAECSLLLAPHPQLAFARIAARFAADDRPDAGIDASVVIHSSAVIGANPRIGAHVQIGAQAVIGDNCAIGSGCVIGRAAQIGDDADIAARVVVADRVQLGKRIIVLPGAVIGSRGFGNVHDGKQWHAMPQMGSVRVGDDVEIGANTTIDRGALGDTVIGDNVRIDNLCQIAHNVEIGARTALASSVGIAGSSKIGSDCLLGGQVGVNGHISICDKVIVNGGSNVLQSIDQPGQYGSGVPLMPVMAWRRFMALMGKLERRIKAIERAVK